MCVVCVKIDSFYPTYMVHELNSRDVKWWCTSHSVWHLDCVCVWCVTWTDLVIHVGNSIEAVLG